MYSVDTLPQLPKPQGLYDPANEHDACGIGFVVNIKGEASHEIVLKGLEILVNLAHRGACGCDAETGDGAGVLIQIPHKFFAKEGQQLGFTLPARVHMAWACAFCRWNGSNGWFAKACWNAFRGKKAWRFWAGAIRRWK